MWVARVAVVVMALAGSVGLGGSRAAADVLVVIDKSSQLMSVAIDGRTRYLWPVSTGRSGYGTPSGRFRPQWMARTYFSRKYYDSPMPYSIFFYRGYAIHGTDSIHRLGGPASHGCVRLHPRHAATLFSLVRRYGMDNTRIIISNSVALQRLEPREEADRAEVTLINRTVDRLMLAQQIERKEAIAKMKQMRATDALRRMQARSSGRPYVKLPEEPVVAIGVEQNSVPYQPEEVVMEPPADDAAPNAAPPVGDAAQPASVRRRASPKRPPTHRAIRDPRSRPSAIKPAASRPRVEYRRDRVTLRIHRW